MEREAPHPLILTWTDNRGVHRRELTRPFTIGRTPENDIMLDAPSVSRRHCVVTPRGPYVKVDASMSTNGVRSGGQRVATLRLPAGGSFTVGGTTFAVEAVGAASPRQAAPVKRAMQPVQLGAIAGAASLGVLVVLVVAAVALTSGGEGTGTDMVSQHVTAAEGGVVAMPGGPSVTFPPGALDRDTEIRIQEIPRPKADSARPLTATFDVDLGGAQPIAPVLVEFPFEAATADGVVNSNTVVVAHYSDSEQQWEQLHSAVDLARQVVSVQTSGFSAFELRQVSSTQLSPFRMPYDDDAKEIAYTGGPHPSKPYQGPYCLDSSKAPSGIDFGMNGKEFEVLSIGAGKIVDVYASGTPKPGSGYWVKIEHDGGIQSSYWHLSRLTDAMNAKRVGEFVPQGFPVGWAGNTGQGTGAPIHAHIELSTGPVKEDDPYSGTPVSWNGRMMDGWTFWQHQKSDSNVGLSYQGSATTGRTKVAMIAISHADDAADPSDCPLAKVDANVVVSDTFTKDQSSGGSDCGLSVPKETVFACASGSGKTHLQSTNCRRIEADSGCDGREWALPQGTWVKAPVNGSTVSESRLELLARAVTAGEGAPAIRYVNFTLATIDPVTGKEQWKSVCTTFIVGADGTYSCALDLDQEGVPRGQFKISFDIRDERDRLVKAPDGVRSLIRSKGDVLGTQTGLSPTINSLGCSPTTVNVNQSVSCSPNISGTVTSRRWGASGGSPSSGSGTSFSTSYGSVGSKTISLQACNGSACTNSSQTVTVQAPQAGAPTINSLGCSPTSVNISQSVTCSPSISGTVTSRSWTASGGSPSSGSGTSFSTSYGTAGSKAIALQACNGAACSSSSQTVTVQAPQASAPTINSLGCSPASVNISQSVSCSPSISGTVTSRSWTASGGSPSSGSGTSFSISYGSAGSKTISLQACNGSACSNSSQTVVVLDPGAQIPAAPSNVRIVNPGTTCLALSCPAFSVAWNDNSNNETGFRVYANGSLYQTVTANLTDVVIDQGTNLELAGTVCFSVLAFNGSGESARAGNACRTLQVDYSLTLDLNDLPDGHTFTIGQGISLCYWLTPSNVPYGVRLFKSTNGSQYELISQWTDTGGGDCIDSTVGSPAGTRTYLAQAVVNGSVVAEDTTFVQVVAAGSGGDPGTQIDAPAWATVCFPDSRGWMFWAPVDGSEGFKIYHNGTLVLTLTGGSSPGTAFHSTDRLPRDLNTTGFSISALAGGSESARTPADSAPCVN